LTGAGGDRHSRSIYAAVTRQRDSPNTGSGFISV
jgi:hypothetical protein